MDIANERGYPTPYATSHLLPLLLLSLATQKHTPDVKSTFRKEYDYVVVGAGSAGSVVASRLSEKPCVSVLLLEAGKSPPMLTEIPALSRHFINTDIDWQYVTTPQRYTAAGHINREVTFPCGKAIGGSGIHNAMLYVRGNRRNYDEWAGLGATGWSYKDVLPYFLKLEDNTDEEFLKNGFHAAGGPITASRPAYRPIKKRAAMKAVLNEGYQFVDPNAYEQIGFYDHQGSIRRGQRCSSAKGYLVPSENRTNLDILRSARVNKVIIQKKRAVGVEFDFNGETHHVRARKEVILSAGTTNTAQLLMLSGIGPMSELKKFKIPLVADLPVGLNFQDHPASFAAYTVDSRLPKFDDELTDEKHIKDYIHTRVGPLTSTEGVQLMSFLSNSGSSSKIPDHSVYFADLASIVPTQLRFNNEVMSKIFQPLANQSVILCFSQLLHTRSVGSVSLQSANPCDPPVIDPNYFADFRDITDVVEGLKTCQRIFNNPALKKINARPVTTPVPGCEEFLDNNDLYLRCIVRTLVITTNHQVGSCRMGDPSDPRTVVDPELRVKGVKRLRVIDASIMPKVSWSNTNIPTIMVAEKASDIIKRTIDCGTDSC